MVINSYLTDYKVEFGDKKFRKLVAEVDSSKRYTAFISECSNRQLKPTPSSFYECIMNSFLVSFSSKSKLVALAMLLLTRWNNEVNSNNLILSQSEVDTYASKIIQQGDQLGF